MKECGIYMDASTEKYDDEESYAELEPLTQPAAEDAATENDEDGYSNMEEDGESNIEREPLEQLEEKISTEEYGDEEPNKEQKTITQPNDENSIIDLDDMESETGKQIVKDEINTEEKVDPFRLCSVADVLQHMQPLYDIAQLNGKKKAVKLLNKLEKIFKEIDY